MSTGDAILRRIGTTLISDMIQVFYSTLFLGMFITLSMAAIHVVIRHRHRDISTWLLLTCLFAIFAMAVTNSLMYILVLIRLIGGALVRVDGETLMEGVIKANQRINGMVQMETWLAGPNGILIQVGDAIVVWRAWVICSTRRRLVYLPILLLLANFGINIGTAVSRMDTGGQAVSTASTLGILYGFGLPLSLVINAIATALIAYTAYENVKHRGGSQGSKTTTQQILIFMTESGMFYCFVQIVAIGLTFSDNVSPSLINKVATAWLSFTTFVSASYPSLIILVAHASSRARDSSSPIVDNEVRFDTGISMMFVARSFHDPEGFPSVAESDTPASSAESGETSPDLKKEIHSCV